MGVHQLLEVGSGDVAEVNGIPDEVTPGDHVGVNLDDRPILCIASLAYAEVEAGRKDDMAYDALGLVRPVSLDVLLQPLKHPNSLFQRLVHLTLYCLPLCSSIVILQVLSECQALRNAMLAL